MALQIRSPTCTAVKICGITKVSQAIAIAELGADAIGVIGVKNSPRFVNEPERRALFSAITNLQLNINTVWVLADPDDLEINSGIKGKGIPSVIQLHGQESPKRCSELRSTYPHIKWWKAIRVKGPEDINLARTYEESIDSLLLDAWSPKALGGTGDRINIKWLRETQFKIPWWLAGGISAEWIHEILRETSPYGIDASSRLEVSPGIKDLKLVNLLIKLIKSKQEVQYNL